MFSILLWIIKTVEINIYCRLWRFNHHGTIEIFFDVCIKRVLLDTVCIGSHASLLLFVVSRRDECVIIVLTRFGIIKKVTHGDSSFYLDIILRLWHTRLSRLEVIFYWVFCTLSLFHLVL